LHSSMCVWERKRERETEYFITYIREQVTCDLMSWWLWNVPYGR
jgi:hypothetical protein